MCPNVDESKWDAADKAEKVRMEHDKSWGVFVWAFVTVFLITILQVGFRVLVVNSPTVITSSPFTLWIFMAVINLAPIFVSQPHNNCNSIEDRLFDSLWVITHMRKQGSHPCMIANTLFWQCVCLVGAKVFAAYCGWALPAQLINLPGSTGVRGQDGEISTYLDTTYFSNWDTEGILACFGLLRTLVYFGAKYPSPFSKNVYQPISDEGLPHKAKETPGEESLRLLREIREWCRRCSADIALALIDATLFIYIFPFIHGVPDLTYLLGSIMWTGNNKIDTALIISFLILGVAIGLVFMIVYAGILLRIKIWIFTHDRFAVTTNAKPMHKKKKQAQVQAEPDSEGEESVADDID